MSCRKPLAVPSDVVYEYDGSLAGLYSCVHACVYSGRMPMDIVQGDTISLIPPVAIETDAEKAQRVRNGITKKIAKRAQVLVETVFLSCLVQKEMHILRFLLMGFERGASVISMLHHDVVRPLMRAEKHLLGEAHLLTGFVRFSDHDGRLLSIIHPKNFVLPYIADHFMDRLSGETFMIYDETHGAALLHEKGQGRIVEVSDLIAPQISEKEAFYQSLWKQFYNTLSIEARYNPKCRMTHMPKRYWADMVEVRDLLTPERQKVIGP